MDRIVRTLGIISCLLLVTACGGDDAGGGSDGGDGDVKRTTYEPGEQATFIGPNGTLDVKISAEATEGSIEELEGFNLEEDERSMTPWYVTRTYENAGEDDITSEDAFTGVVDAFDDTGVEPRQLALLGDFTRCELVNAPDPFPAGESFTSCDVYLVEEGRTLEKLVVTDTQFEGANREYEWKVG